MSQSQSPRPVVPSLTALVLNLATESGAGLVLRSAETTWSDGSRKFGALGDPWKSTSTPQSREKLVLLCACYRLHELAYPGKSREFRFRDHKPYPISVILSQKTDVNYWDQALFGTDGIKCFCQGKSEIRIRELVPEQVTISLDGDVLQLNEGSDDVPRLVDLIRQLAGDNQPDDYPLRYAGKRLAELLTPRFTSALPPENEPSQHSAPPAATDPEVGTMSRFAETREQAQPKDTTSILQIDRTSLKLIDHDGERCVVAVRVNGKIRGTGFVVGEGVVVTCAHVVLPDDKTPDDLPPTVRYSIEYLALMGTGAENDAVSRAVAVQDVELDRQHFSRHSKNDVAFLIWPGRVPEGVKIGRLSTRGNLGGRRCRVKGFAEYPPFEILTAVVDVAATGGKREAKPILNLNQANSILSGHSGGPLFDCDTNAIVGMVSAANGAPDAVSWHGVEYRFAVKCETIVAIWPQLFRDDRAAEIDRHLTTTASNLRTAMKDCLLRYPRAQSVIAEQLQRGDLVQSSEATALALVKTILEDDPQDVVPALCLAEGQLRVGPAVDVEAANGLIEFYCLFMPGIVSLRSKDDVRLILEQVRGVHRGPVIVPTSSKTILELYLAAMDGVAVRWNQSTAREAESPRHHLLDDIPEAGFQNADINTTVIVNHLIQNLGGQSFPPGFQDWSADAQIVEVNEKLRLWHKKNQTKAIVVSRELSEEQQEALREMLMYVAIVQLSQTRGLHRELIHPFTQDNFPLPS